MALDLKTRQYFIFSSFLALTAILSAAAYWYLCPQWVYYRRGENYFIARKFAQAIPFYREALAAGLKRPEALIHLGQAYLATKQFPEALKVFEHIVLAHPQDLEAAEQLAALYDQFGRVNAAIELLQRQQQLAGGRPAILLRLAELYKRRKDFTDAAQLYRQVLEKHPDSLPVQLKLAELLGWMKQYDEAIKICRKILAKHPENRAARLNLARVLSWKGQTEEAVKEYRRFLGESP